VARPTAILRSPSRWCLEAAPILQSDYLNRFLTYDDRLITTKRVYYLEFHVLHKGFCVFNFFTFNNTGGKIADQIFEISTRDL